MKKESKNLKPLNSLKLKTSPPRANLLRGDEATTSAPRMVVSVYSRMVDRVKLESLILILSLLNLLSPLPTFAAKTRVRVKAPSSTNSGGSVRQSVYDATFSSVKFRADRKAIIMTLSNMENVSTVSYQLTYQTNGISQGVMGKIDPSIEPTATRELLFGTCSAGVCTYHTNITNAKLTISSQLSSGLTVIKPYRIKP